MTPQGAALSRTTRSRQVARAWGPEPATRERPPRPAPCSRDSRPGVPPWGRRARGQGAPRVLGCCDTRRTHAVLGGLGDQLRQMHLPRDSSTFLVSRVTATRKQITRDGWTPNMGPRHCLPGWLTPPFPRDRENGSSQQLGEGTSAAAQETRSGVKRCPLLCSTWETCVVGKSSRRLPTARSAR